MGISVGRGAGAAVCVAALTVSALYPAWGAVLQTQAYGGYADIVLHTLGLPSNTIPGVGPSLPLRVTNLGPDAVEHPQVVFSADPLLQLTATTGCLGSPAPLPRCQLPPMAPGDSFDIDFSAGLPPWARGMVTLGAYASAETIDTVPGNEMIIAAPRIDAYVNLEVRLLDEQPVIGNDGWLEWTIEVANHGPSTALVTAISTNVFPTGAIVCAVQGQDSSCPDGTGARIGALSSLIFTMHVPPLGNGNASIYFYLSAHPVETDTDPDNNLRQFSYDDLLFAHDFD